MFLYRFVITIFFWSACFIDREGIQPASRERKTKRFNLAVRESLNHLLLLKPKLPPRSWFWLSPVAEVSCFLKTLAFHSHEISQITSRDNDWIAFRGTYSLEVMFVHQLNVFSLGLYCRGLGVRLCRPRRDWTPHSFCISALRRE
jgi:hypothetical protein